MNLLVNNGLSVQHSQVKQSLCEVELTALPCQDLIPRAKSFMGAERRHHIPSQWCQELLPGRLSSHCALEGLGSPGWRRKRTVPGSSHLEEAQSSQMGVGLQIQSAQVQNA